MNAPSARVGCFFSSTSARLIVCVATRSAPDLGGNGAGRFSDTTAICAQPAKKVRQVPAAMARIWIDVLECLEFMNINPYSRHRSRHLRSEEHTSELQSPYDLVCRLLLEKKNRRT